MQVVIVNPEDIPAAESAWHRMEPPCVCAGTMTCQDKKNRRVAARRSVSR